MNVLGNIRVVIVVLAAGLLSSGCGRATPPAVKVVVNLPHATPNSIENLICSELEPVLTSAEGVAAITFVSTLGRAEIYLLGEPGVAAEDFAENVDTAMEGAVTGLPADAAAEMAEFLPARPFPPEVPVHNVSELSVDVDHKKANALGVTDAVLAEAVASAEMSPDEFAELQIETGDGAMVPLITIAKLRVVNRPSHQVRHWTKAGTR